MDPNPPRNLDLEISFACHALAAKIKNCIPIPPNQEHYANLQKEVSASLAQVMRQRFLHDSIRLLQKIYIGMLFSVNKYDWNLGFLPELKHLIGLLKELPPNVKPVELIESLESDIRGFETDDSEVEEDDYDENEEVPIRLTDQLEPQEQNYPPHPPTIQTPCIQVLPTSAPVILDISPAVKMGNLAIVALLMKPHVNPDTAFKGISIQLFEKGTGKCVKQGTFPATIATIKEKFFEVRIDANNIPFGDYLVTIKADGWTHCFNLAAKLGAVNGSVAYRILPQPCCFTCQMGFSLKVQNSCVTGFELVRLLHSIVNNKIRNIQRQFRIPDVQNILQINHGARWLMTAGCLQELNITMQALNVYQGCKYFDTQKKICVGVTNTIIEIKTETECRVESQGTWGYNSKHPRVKYPTNRSKKDLPYSALPDCLTFGGKKKEGVKAGELLALLKTGENGNSGDELKNDAAFLVHIFGVEANKNNLCYVTAVMGLQLVVDEALSFKELFVECDPSNQFGLKGSGGLLSMASWGGFAENERRINATLGILKTMIESSDDQVGLCMQVVGTFKGKNKEDHAEWIIPLKEMRLINLWCEKKLTDIETLDKGNAITFIRQRFSELLDEFFHT